jgi:hypothetical protein
MTATAEYDDDTPDLVDIHHVMILAHAFTQAAEQLGWEARGEGYDSVKDQYRIYFAKGDDDNSPDGEVDVILVPRG